MNPTSNRNIPTDQDRAQAEWYITDVGDNASQ